MNKKLLLNFNLSTYKRILYVFNKLLLNKSQLVFSHLNKGFINVHKRLICQIGFIIIILAIATVNIFCILLSLCSPIDMPPY